MDNQEIFEKILKGKDERREYEFEGLPGPITLRPLTSGELVDLQALEKQGMAATLKMKNFTGMPREERRRRVKEQIQDLESQIDFSELRRTAAAVKYRAISYSAEISEDMVKELPPRLVDDIFEKVMEISEVTEEDLDLLNDFRGRGRGEGSVGGSQ